MPKSNFWGVLIVLWEGMPPRHEEQELVRGAHLSGMSFMSSNLHPLNTLSLPKSSLNILRHQVSILFLCDSVFGASAAEFKITDLDPFYISNVLKYRTDGCRSSERLHWLLTDSLAVYGPFVLKIKISALLCGIEFSYSQYESPAVYEAPG